MNAVLSPDWIGFFAATLTTISFVPQVIKTWRSRSAADVSIGMYSLFTMGVALWICYGFYLHARPIIIANIITLLLAGCVLAMKLRWG